MKILPLIVVILLLGLNVVFGHGGNFTETKEFIDSGVSCDELTEERLEEIGDYYMEQMHPGEAHEVMDKMMGGEGSDSLKQMHIQMAKRLYCNEDVSGMMGGGMMNMMGSGGMNMMGGSFGGGSWWLWNIIGLAFWVVGLIALILLTIWLYKKVRKMK